MPYPERLERDVRRGHALRRSGLVPLLSLSQSSQHEIYCFPRGRVIYTLRVCYDYHIIKYSRRYKTGATTTIHISIVSVCIGSQKKKRNTKFLDECVQECRVFIPLLNFSQQIQGVGEEGRYTFARRSQRSRVVAEQLPFSAARQIIGCFSLYTIFLLPGS